MKAESPRRDELRVLGKTRGGGRNMVGSRAAVRGQSMEDFKKREFILSIMGSHGFFQSELK